ncbi:zinc and cadmium transporter [Luteibacter sp. OK325]|jgi:zinc and cadmium transporter|uniref:ZIP family metal transporter n=1 Tax=Luteibacter sp. OK325 TaxID=2135670 RepID=UPI000D36CA75|nr:ZIP family metal transporter [Luteibacter sp. OK325]PTR32927.1 zinc and cadmium transporter [Luteibacter sp. OK325]
MIPVHEVLLAACFLGATSLVSRLVAWLPGGALSPWLVWLQSLAVGLLVGDALLHVLPEALETGQPFDHVMLALAAGALALVVVESWVRRAPLVPMLDGTQRTPFARMNLAGDFVHHLVDGIIVAAAFLAGESAGIAVMLAIALHEVPRELSSASVLVAGGYPPRRAFALSVLMALGVPAGALLMHLVPLSPGRLALALAAASGTVLYVALADILPGIWARLAPNQRAAPVIGASAGLLVMWLAARMEQG